MPRVVSGVSPLHSIPNERQSGFAEATSLAAADSGSIVNSLRRLTNASMPTSPIRSGKRRNRKARNGLEESRSTSKPIEPCSPQEDWRRAAALVSEERTLQELRLAHRLTQKRMAEVLGSC